MPGVPEDPMYKASIGCGALMVILGIWPTIALASCCIHYGLTGIVVALFVVAAGFVQNKILSIVAVVFCVIGLLMDFVYQKDIGDGCALIDALTDPTDPVVAEVDFCDSAGALRACLGIQAVVALVAVGVLCKAACCSGGEDKDDSGVQDLER